MDNRTSNQLFDLKPAPDWMIRQMSGQENANPQTTFQTDPALEKLSSHCKMFEKDWGTQRTTGLWEEQWFKWSSLLVNSAGLDSALTFSSASNKHDQQSESRLQQLQDSKNNKLVRCTNFGCNQLQIDQCFSGKLRWNETGKLKNSPGAFLKITNTSNTVTSKRSVNLKQIGFVLDAQTNKICNLNGNIYARHLLQNKIDLIYSSGRLYVYESNVWKYKDANAISRILRHILHEYVPDFWAPGIESKYMEALKVEAPRVDKMDSDRNLINLINGMVDLTTFKVRVHDKKYHSTIQIPIVYNPSAECPMFRRFLAEVFQNDNELIQLTAEMLGYCLTAEVRAQKAFILYGKGSNGKSVLADVLKRLCGIENVSSVSLNELDNSFARAEIVDKLLNLATENEVGSFGLNTQYFKSIVSGDPIRVERKHEQGFTYESFCKLMFALNNLPYAKDKSYGFLRRLIIIPFNWTIKKEEADVHLMDKLATELPGILNFALKGLEKLKSNEYKFTESKAANQILKEYSEELNPVESFVEEMIVKGNFDERIMNKTLGDTFKTWCLEQGHSTLAQYSQVRLINNIKEILKGKGINTDKGKTGGSRYLSGVKMIAKTTTLNSNVSVGDIDEID